MDEIISIILGSIGRLVTWLVIDVLMHIVCYGIGWITSKVLTFGSYPKKETNDDTVMLIGFFVLMLLVIGLTVYVYIHSR